MSGVDWPKIVYAVGTPDYPDEGVGLYRDELPHGLKDNPDHEVRRYEPHPPALDAKDRERLGEIAYILDTRGLSQDATFLRHLASHQPEPQQEGRVSPEDAERVESALSDLYAERDRFEEALRYITGEDVAGMEGHERPQDVARAALDLQGED